MQRHRIYPPMSVLVVCVALTACGEAPAPVAAPAGQPSSASGDPGYLAPPAVTAVLARAEGWRLTGAAPVQSRVRLATPEGKTVFAEADDKGVWSLVLTPAAQPRIFGLSATLGGRTVQGEGYLLVTQTGEAVLLRAGAGALRIGREGRNGLDAVDFDRGGGAIISGRAPAGAALSIHVDGRKLAEGRADANGRYAIALTQRPLSGRRQIDVFGDATESTFTVEAVPAAPLAAGPFRAQAVSGGLRVDWMTPGGGVQSTVLVQ